MSHVNQSIFFPTCALEGKENYKQLFRVEKNGSITERVFLDVPDPSQRELLICLHYLRHITKHFYTKEIGIKIISRDSPWDFKVQLSTEETFNIEITSIADSSQHFMINKREERLSIWRTEEKIPLHELKKLDNLFPCIGNSKIIEKHTKNGLSKNDLVSNPFLQKETLIMLGNLFEPEISLEKQIQTAIDKKTKKRHSEKEQTILIIDNRTSAFDAPEYYDVAERLSPLLESAPFPEVWFYTGYCSDNDGNNAEFSFSPLKVTELQAKILYTLSKEKTNDGRVIW